MQDPQILAQTRSDLQLSQADLAKEAGIGSSLLCMIETGQRRMTESIAQKLWSAMWHIDQARKPAKNHGY